MWGEVQVDRRGWGAGGDLDGISKFSRLKELAPGGYGRLMLETSTAWIQTEGKGSFI